MPAIPRTPEAVEAEMRRILERRAVSLDGLSAWIDGKLCGHQGDTVTAGTLRLWADYYCNAVRQREEQKDRRLDTELRDIWEARAED